MFSENLFSISNEEKVAKFNGQITSIQKNYDESTCLVVAESGYIIGDKFPDIRGLLHIKNDIEQKLFSKEEEKKDIIMLLWSA